jgi:hypothetical protein
MLPDCPDDYVGDNTVLADAFINELDMVPLGFEGVAPIQQGARPITLRRC